MKDKKYNPFSRILNNQKGVSAILVAILLPVLIGFAALAIDVGYMYATKNELQNVADAAALAGASALGRIYLDIPKTQHHSYELTSQDEGQIREAAKLVALENEAARTSIAIQDSDIYIGHWDFDENDPAARFKDNVTPPTQLAPAVRADARRDSILNNPVSTFFARIFGGGSDTFQAIARATAAISGPSVLAEGIANAPFAISENNPCDGPITFSPTPDSCAGWHNYLDHNANSNDITAKMYGHIANHDEGSNWLSTHGSVSATAMSPPELRLGDLLTLSGQQGANYFNGFWYNQWDTSNQPDPDSYERQGPNDYAPLVALFDFFRFRDGDDDGTGAQLDVCGTFYDPDDVWTTVAPMYKDTRIDGCSNPNSNMEIVGFAYIQMVEFRGPPDYELQLVVCMNCDKLVEPGRSGGGTIGSVVGAIPNLVE